MILTYAIFRDAIRTPMKTIPITLTATELHQVVEAAIKRETTSLTQLGELRIVEYVLDPVSGNSVEVLLLKIEATRPQQYHIRLPRSK